MTLCVTGMNSPLQACLHECRGASIQYEGVFVLPMVLYAVKFSHHTHSKCRANNHDKTLATIVLTVECVCVWVQVTQEDEVRSQWITEQPLKETIRGRQREERGEARLMKYECVY